MWPFKKPEKKPQLKYIIKQNGYGKFRGFRIGTDENWQFDINILWRDTLEEAEQDIANDIEWRKKSKSVVVAEYYKVEYPTYDLYKHTP
jgi:hypothetical protein